MKFDECVEIILKHEGEYSFDPRDPGGETRFGIAKRFYPSVDIKNLTIEHAKDIYKKDYWDAFAIEFLPAKLRLAFFDCCVNQGGYAARILLQRTLKVNEDGAIGPETLAALRRSGPDLLTNYLTERALKYTKTRNFDYFGKGWFRRIFDISSRSKE